MWRGGRMGSGSISGVGGRSEPAAKLQRAEAWRGWARSTRRRRSWRSLATRLKLMFSVARNHRTWTPEPPLRRTATWRWRRHPPRVEAVLGSTADMPGAGSLHIGEAAWLGFELRWLSRPRDSLESLTTGFRRSTTRAKTSAAVTRAKGGARLPACSTEELPGESAPVTSQHAPCEHELPAAPARRDSSPAREGAGGPGEATVGPGAARPQPLGRYRFRDPSSFFHSTFPQS